jgi:Undecaprenyl-phosphate glucose phosphotransferase
MKSVASPSVGSLAPGSRTDVLGRLRLSYEQFGALAALSDISAVVIASVTSGGIYHWLAFGQIGNIVAYFGLGIIAGVLTAALMELRGLYSPDSLLSVRSCVRSIVMVWIGVFLFLLAISFTLKISDELSRGSALSLAFVAPCLVLLGRLMLRNVMLIILQKDWLKRRKVLVISSYPNGLPEGPEMLRAYECVDRRLLGQGARSLGSEFRSVVNGVKGSATVDEIHLLIDWTRWSEIKSAVVELRALPLPVRLIADRTAHEILQLPRGRSGDTFTFELQRAPLQPSERLAKRAFDLVIAAVALIALAPVLLLVALAIKLDSRGPILFRQSRGGFNGRAFAILKFRSMHVMDDGTTIVQATQNDRRVTRIGRWLRRSSLDEMPQLINVLRGEMSLVGPRPHALAHDAEYSRLISRYSFRHHVKPGMTGWAQVKGFRGETPNPEMMKARVLLDLSYVRNWSFWLDIKIILLTVIKIVRSPNAF